MKVPKKPQRSERCGAQGVNPGMCPSPHPFSPRRGGTVDHAVPPAGLFHSHSQSPVWERTCRDALLHTGRSGASHARGVPRSAWEPVPISSERNSPTPLPQGLLEKNGCPACPDALRDRLPIGFHFECSKKSNDQFSLTAPERRLYIGTIPLKETPKRWYTRFPSTETGMLRQEKR